MDHYSPRDLADANPDPMWPDGPSEQERREAEIRSAVANVGRILQAANRATADALNGNDGDNLARWRSVRESAEDALLDLRRALDAPGGAE